MVLFPSEEFLNSYAPLTPVYGCGSLVAHQADDVFRLWEAWENESSCECPIPYWAVVWPGAIALAHYLLAHRESTAGKEVLDLGCGSGIAGIASARAGAKGVIANDIDPVALYICRRNTEANGVSIVSDGRDLTRESHLSGIDLVLVADMFYQLEQARALTTFLRRLRQKGAAVIVADGQRSFAPRSGFTLISEEHIPVNEELEGTAVRRVRILSLED